MAWTVTDAAAFSSFTNGTFESPFSSGSYPQNSATYRYRSQRTFEYTTAFAQSGTGAARWRSPDAISGGTDLLELFTGKGRTNGKRYTITGKMMLKPSLTPGIWHDSDVVEVRGILFGVSQVFFTSISQVRDNWGSFSIQAVCNSPTSAAVDAVKLSIIVDYVSAGFIDPLNGADVYFDQLTCVEETNFPDTPLSVTYTKTDATTIDGTDGTITLVPTGGSGSRTYAWGDGPTSQNRVNLAAGVYTVAITDTVTSQVVNLSITIFEPDPVPTLDGTTLIVPAMNSITFSENVTPNSCSTYQQLDNVLFCNQKHPYYAKARYSQKIAKCDEPPIQFYSNYENNFVTLHKTSDDTLVKTYEVVLKEQLLGNTEDYGISIRNHTIPGQSRVYFGIGEIPIPLSVGDVFEIMNNLEGFDGPYSIVAILNDDTLGYQYLVINKTYVGAGTSSTATGRFDISTEDFNVLEAVATFGDLADGEYYAKITAYTIDEEDGQVRYSEPINLKVEHPDTNLVKYKCFDNAFDMTWTTGIICLVRVESVFFKRIPGGERTLTRDSNFRLVKVSARKQRIILFETFMLPPYLHEKLSVIFDCDYITVNGIEVQAAEGYGEPKYLTRYPLANSEIKLEQVGWFDQYNSDDLGTVSDEGFLLGNGGGRLLR